MMKIGALTLFGCLAGSLAGFLAMPASAQASDTPAFVNATMCDAAAPVTAASAILHRQIRAEMPTTRRPAPPTRRHAAAQNRRHAARPAPRHVEQAEAPAAENEAVLRPAVHFCVSPAGANSPVRYT